MDKFNQTEILEALNRLNQSKEDTLDLESLNKAEEQVWLSISKALSTQQSLNSIPIPNNNTLLKSNNQPNSNWQQQWKQKHRLVFTFLGSFVIFTVIAISTYNLILKWEKQQASLDSVQPNLIEPVPFQELRNKAETKFVKLSNGISFQELQEGINEPKGKPTSITSQPNYLSIDEKLKQEIQAKIDPDNLTVFFSESEEKYFLPDLLPANFANLDISKNVTIQTWIGGNYYKAIYYHDNKIIDLNLDTPEYSIHYLGGKYGIKGIFTEPYYSSGVVISPRDGEIELLKSLLNPSDPNMMVDYGLQTIDGKKLRVIEIKYGQLPLSSNTDTSAQNENTSTSVDNNQNQTTNDYYIVNESTKYFFDQNDLSLYLVEYYGNNQLLKQTKIIKNQILEKQQADQVFHYQELSNLPIKEYKIHTPNPDDSLVTNFVKEQNLFFIPELGIENVAHSWLYRNDFGNTEEYYFDPDFNPYLKNEDLLQKNNVPIPPKNLLGSYGQIPINFDIYEQDKPSYEEIFYYYYIADTSFKVKQERDIQILLDDDKPIKGKYIELTRYYNNPPKDENPEVGNYLIIEFKVGKYLYILIYDSENSTISESTDNFDLKNYLSQDQIKLSKLTLEQAKEIDQKKSTKNY